ncbi:putative UPF0452 protein C7orf41 like protein [Cricetulus griseus]|nr:putative UPF0452 protein C7orf41 like protein [Cricetulus griseus]
MDFQQLADVAEKWCSSTPFELIAAEESERRMDFYADPGVSFYVLCPDNGCGDSFGGRLHNCLLTSQGPEFDPQRSHWAAYCLWSATGSDTSNGQGHRIRHL